MVPIDLHCIFSMEINGDINCLVTHILQNIFFYIPQKEEIHTGLEQLVNDNDNFSFLGELPF